MVAEQVDQVRVELGSPALAGDGEGRLDLARLVEDLDHIGEVHQSCGGMQLGPAQPLRVALPVPSLKRLRDTVADRVIQP